MFYIYIGSIIASYLVTRSNVIKVEKKLKADNLNTKETINDKHMRDISLMIISCIPLINLITMVGSMICTDDLYNTFKRVECESIIEDNKELLSRYEEACETDNHEYRKRLEKQISIANTLINSGFDKEEALSKITEKNKTKKLGTMPTKKISK